MFVLKKRGSFGSVLAAPLCPFITTVFVEFYLNIRLHKFAFVRKQELHIPDVEPALNPLVLIIRVYAEDLASALVKPFGVVQVFRAQKDRKRVLLDHEGRVGEKEV